MTTIGSPLRIKILLHCYVGLNETIADSPAAKEEIKSLCELGVLKEREGWMNQWETTPLGNAWALALCNVPLPRAVFIDEQGRILNHEPHTFRN